MTCCCRATAASRGSSCRSRTRPRPSAPRASWRCRRCRRVCRYRSAPRRAAPVPPRRPPRPQARPWRFCTRPLSQGLSGAREPAWLALRAAVECRQYQPKMDQGENAMETKRDVERFIDEIKYGRLSRREIMRMMSAVGLAVAVMPHGRLGQADEGQPTIFTWPDYAKPALWNRYLSKYSPKPKS